jgi:DNA-binding MarR family transcriptional regulator
VEPPASRVDAIAMALELSALLVIRQLVDRTELSTTASDVLHRLDTEGPARLTALCCTAGISQPAMTQLIQRFERRGIVEREVDPDDGRVSVVVITDAGRELLKERRRGLRDRLAALLLELDPDEQAALELASRVARPFLLRLNGDEALDGSRNAIA